MVQDSTGQYRTPHVSKILRGDAKSQSKNLDAAPNAVQAKHTLHNPQSPGFTIGFEVSGRSLGDKSVVARRHLLY